MKKLTLPVLIAVIATFLVIGVMWAKEHTVVLESKYGKVEFAHQKHGSLKCQECHHTLKEGEESAKPCSECHKAGADVDAKKAFHTTCRDCHKETAKGPQKCKECHQK